MMKVRYHLNGKAVGRKEWLANGGVDTEAKVRETANLYCHFFKQ